ncbi:MAG: T9SS type A sorting domain-containing protein [Ignavibacteriales bacterium]|nr:T9SS type A sorting domain-containing protein [Ignavibacteriales bacterium]
MKIAKHYITIFSLISASLFCSENPNRILSQSAVQTPLAWTRYAIEGYALPTSVKAGETIKLYVSVCDSGTQHTDYRIRIFRLPDTANALYISSVIAGRFYSLHDSVGNPIDIGDYSRRAVDFQKGCTQYWDSSAVSFYIPLNWKSGLYYAQLEHQSPSVFQNRYYAPFIVRSPNPGTMSKILFKYDFSTNQAYNYWGGGSLYSKSQDPSLTISDTISIERPMWYELSRTIRCGYANQFIKTLEDSGMVMDYCNNIDVDSLGLPFLSAYKTLVLWQHDEYWTQKERDETESFIGRNDSHLHNNLARFSANTCYWRTQWLNGSHTQLRCDKWWVGLAYPKASRFRNIDPTKPEGKFLGSQYERAYNNEDMGIPSDSIVTPGHWIFRGLGLKCGDTLGHGYSKNGRWYGILGTELDNSTQSNGKADYPTTILAKRYVRSYKDGGSTEMVLHEMIYYEDTLSNARVFGLGAGALSAALYPCAGNDRAKVQQMIVNIMSHFSEQKYVGNIYAPDSYPLEWKSNIRLDGMVRILPNRKLLIKGSPTITIDSMLVVDGELEINGDVTVAGTGSVNINPGGILRIQSGSKFTIEPTALSVASGARVIHGSGVTVHAATYELGQNYPNPFNPSTTICYAVPSSSRVSIKIYNVLGQEIADLNETEQQSGWHETVWNASVASGLYFYRIEAVSSQNPQNRFVAMKKMMLLR